MRELVQASGGDIEGERSLAVMLDLAEAVDLRFSGSQFDGCVVDAFLATLKRESERAQASLVGGIEG